MHEFSLVKKEVERIKNKIEGKKVSSAVFFLGRLAHGTPDSIREAFKIASVNTPLAHAKLEVKRINPKVKCLSCGKIFSLTREINFSCPLCNSKSNELIAGEECYIDSIEVEE
ncbi:MAG: hydrogenase maturation nickel metallochaperone HypA [Candidatus Omnitrophica bacterium]|nr:hydrogenase maturation nickel metallochaperone HypA [Candidatus Omnitrophota bacterium]MDD5352513.1 hydrogenase maturation nickel metallochaperone HypA [Candidatus Omnitrophota bacterium]MDD5550111.1 hydrogenase maturation nickel metallochaperone HypA [Candidatus Omnitrophota bacterium]